MRLGYSCWGCLGPGVVETPDGLRAYRRPLIDGLTDAGHEVVLVQANRDLAEAGLDLRDRYTYGGLPDLDALMLEWRWPLPGRNTTPCGTPGRTCDLHRQIGLLEHYTRACGTPTVIWDLDRQLPADDPSARCRTSRCASSPCTRRRAPRPCGARSPTPRWTPPTRRRWRVYPGRCRWCTWATSTTVTTPSTNGRWLVGHNIGVDWRLLHRRCASIAPAGLIDTLRLARACHLDAGGNSLTTLLDHLELTATVTGAVPHGQPHRALWDTVGAAVLLGSLVSRRWPAGVGLAGLCTVAALPDVAPMQAPDTLF
ncbi:hypothetical protein [Krasilnikovia sp. MM14-A1259]|uniref:3'-5' exonuclease n=1 Tax=Krasilnikovia sp. MM14-A1259 TaxID=3373539 RepID=UPI0037F40992